MLSVVGLVNQRTTITGFRFPSRGAQRVDFCLILQRHLLDKRLTPGSFLTQTIWKIVSAHEYRSFSCISAYFRCVLRQSFMVITVFLYFLLFKGAGQSWTRFRKINLPSNIDLIKYRCSLFTVYVINGELIEILDIDIFNVFGTLLIHLVWVLIYSSRKHCVLNA